MKTKVPTKPRPQVASGPGEQAISNWFFDRWDAPILAGKAAAMAMRVNARTLFTRIERGQARYTNTSEGNARPAYAFTAKQIVENLLAGELAMYGITPSVLKGEPHWNWGLFCKILEIELRQKRRLRTMLYVTLEDGCIANAYPSERTRCTFSGSYVTIPIGKFVKRAAAIAWHKIHNPFAQKLYPEDEIE